MTNSTVQAVRGLATPPNCLQRRAEGEYLSILTIHVSLETPCMLQLEARRKSIPTTNLLSFSLQPSYETYRLDATRVRHSTYFCSRQRGRGACRRRSRPDSCEWRSDGIVAGGFHVLGTWWLDTLVTALWIISVTANSKKV